MKKIIGIIITLSIFFSSQSTTFAGEGYIEKLLDLNYGVEKTELDFSEIKYFEFDNQKYINMYYEFKTADQILRKEFMKNYRNGTYSYYQMRGIVTNYNNFIYYSNKYFYYIGLKDRGYSYTELDSAILKSYTNMRRSFRILQNVIKD